MGQMLFTRGTTLAFIQDFELGGGHGGSRMIVACESMLTHASACVPTRGVWGHAPPEKF